MSPRDPCRGARARVWVVVAAAVLGLGAALPVHAQTRLLDDARAADRDGDIERARRAYERVLEQARATPDELVECHVRLGVLTAAMGDAQRARTHFGVALALSPDLDAPRDLSPAQLRELESLRRERGGRRLLASLVAPSTHELARPLSLAIEARNAGGAGVARMRVRVEPDGFEQVVDGVGPATVVVPERAVAAASISISLALLDEHGATLATTSSDVSLREPSRAGTSAAPVAPRARIRARADPFRAQPIASREASADRPSVWASPWLWLTVGVVIAAGTTAGVLVATADGRVDVGAPVIR